MDVLQGADILDALWAMRSGAFQSVHASYYEVEYELEEAAALCLNLDGQSLVLRPRADGSSVSIAPTAAWEAEYSRTPFLRRDVSALDPFRRLIGADLSFLEVVMLDQVGRLLGLCVGMASHAPLWILREDDQWAFRSGRHLSPDLGPGGPVTVRRVFT